MRFMGVGLNYETAQIKLRDANQDPVLAIRYELL
jgi:hypothetical protein